MFVLCLTVAGWAALSARVITVASGVTTNTTTAVRGVPPSFKTFMGVVVCSSGACTQTQEIFGDTDDDGLNGISLCTITLSGTPRHQDACPPMSATFPFYYITTTNTTGTGATGAVYAAH